MIKLFQRKKSPQPVPFDNVAYGECFRAFNQIWLKLDTTYAVSLNKTHQRLFDANTPVNPVSATLRWSYCA